MEGMQNNTNLPYIYSLINQLNFIYDQCNKMDELGKRR
jgi:hypothetical protein